MTKHTPGPWQLAENDPTIIITEAVDEGGDARLIADVLCVLKDRNPMDEHKANACLIAAAPDLLTAAQDCVAWLKQSGVAICECGALDCRGSRLLAAIAKATATAA